MSPIGLVIGLILAVFAGASMVNMGTKVAIGVAVVVMLFWGIPFSILLHIERKKRGEKI